MIAVFLLAVAVGVFAWPREPGGFRGWLAAVRDGDDDWGWDFISDQGQIGYRGGMAAYVEDMAAADWDALDLGTPVDVWSDDSFYSVEVQLHSDPATVPEFLLRWGIIRGVCDQDEQPIGIGAFEDRGPLRGQRFDGGGLSGYQGRCNAGFADASHHGTVRGDGSLTPLACRPMVSGSQGGASPCD